MPNTWLCKCEIDIFSAYRRETGDGLQDEDSKVSHEAFGAKAHFKVYAFKSVNCDAPILPSDMGFTPTILKILRATKTIQTIITT